jgi:DNA replication protein
MSLTNSQYNEIIRAYNKKQLENVHQLNKRVDEVYSHSPLFKKIDNEIASLSIQKAKNLLAGDTTATASLKEAIDDLAEQRTLLLASTGHPPDYLKMQYTCADCQDTGYFDNQKCHCFKQAQLNLLYNHSNMKELLDTENFTHFSYKYYPNDITDEATNISALQNIQHVVQRCQDFITNFDTDFQNLCFYGDTGVGKTFLSNCIAKELIERFHSVIYFTAFQLFESFAQSTFHTDGGVKHFHQSVFDCDLLIIDDLGTELTNSFVSSQLFLCINERILRKKSTIISTNLPLDIFAETYSERIFSRITSNYTMLKLFGNDIRIFKKTQ